MGQTLRKEMPGQAHWALFVLAVCDAYRAFRSVFRFVSDSIISDICCVVCTHTALFIKKQKTLRDFQIIFQIIFALY